MTIRFSSSVNRIIFVTALIAAVAMLLVAWSDHDWRSHYPPLAFALTQLWLIAVTLVSGAWLLYRPDWNRALRILLLLSTGFVGVVITGIEAVAVVTDTYHAFERRQMIEYLETQTPIGTDRLNVEKWLAGHGDVVASHENEIGAIVERQSKPVNAEVTATYRFDPITG